jgi:hypothetical protein
LRIAPIALALSSAIIASFSLRFPVPPHRAPALLATARHPFKVDFTLEYPFEATWPVSPPVLQVHRIRALGKALAKPQCAVSFEFENGVFQFVSSHVRVLELFKAKVALPAKRVIVPVDFFSCSLVSAIGEVILGRFLEVMRAGYSYPPVVRPVSPPASLYELALSDSDLDEIRDVLFDSEPPVLSAEDEIELTLRKDVSTGFLPSLSEEEEEELDQ